MSYSIAIIITYLESTFMALKPVSVVYWGAGIMLSTYLLLATMIWLLAKIINRPFEDSPIQPKQIITDITESIRTIIIFAIGLVIPWVLLKFEIAVFAHQLSLQSIALESLLLIVWQDVHFYLVHRFAHTKLNATKDTHHRHTVLTPYNAYNLSVIEAILLTTTLPVAMLFYDFSLVSIIIMLIWSMTIHTLAHSNCNLFSSASEHSPLGFIKHHARHHKVGHGHYSLFITALDRWCKTDRS